MPTSLRNGFSSYFCPHSVALTYFVLAPVPATGLTLGAICVKGFSLGVPGVVCIDPNHEVACSIV